MTKKEINIFGTSFLDLLSGALAAVIILFVIVPKMSSEQQNTLEEIERLNVQVTELSEIMEQVRNSVPQDVFDEIQNRLNELQNTVSELTTQVENLQNRLAVAEEENTALRQELELLREEQNRNQQLEAENRRLAEENRHLQEELAQRPESNSNGISDGKVFGMNAKLGIVCMWKELEPDVDLYVKNISTGTICYYGNKNPSPYFGSLMEDVRTRSTSEDDRYELFYQTKIVPGTYQIYVNVYAGENGVNRGQPTNATVEGYIVMNPGKPNQIKIPYDPFVLTQKGVNKSIGTLIVTENNIQLQ